MHITFSVITHQYWNWPLVYIGSDIQLQIINSNSGPKFSPVFSSPHFCRGILTRLEKAAGKWEFDLLNSFLKPGSVKNFAKIG